MPNSQTAFFPQLESYITKYIVPRPVPLTPAEIAEQPIKGAEAVAALFEQLLLFDELAIRIRGQNLPLVMLHELLGTKGVEELIDQDALRFIQWKPTVFNMVTNIKGVNALAFGDLKSPVFDDPEASITSAFAALKNPPPQHEIRAIKRKAIPLYQDAESSIAKKGSDLARAAYLSGKLKPFNLPPDRPFDDLPLPMRQRLNAVATEIAEYSYVLDHCMTSLSNYTYFKLLTETAEKLATTLNQAEAFTELGRIENFPDLKSLFPTLANPFQQVIKLRGNTRSRRFREWLANTNGGSAELTAEYIAAIADTKGAFDTNSGKFIKAIAMTAISGSLLAGVGGVAGALLGAATGAVVSKVTDPVLETGLDLLDKFVLDGLLKGWSPRMFFDDLRALEHVDLRRRS